MNFVNWEGRMLDGSLDWSNVPSFPLSIVEIFLFDVDHDLIIILGVLSFIGLDLIPVFDRLPFALSTLIFWTWIPFILFTGLPLNCLPN